MNLADLVQTLGYPAVALGALLEGESVLIAAGIAVHLGYLKLLPVILIALVFSFAGDQMLFHLGRKYGPRILERWPRLARGMDRANALIARHPDKIVIGIRFMVGLRFVGLLALGMSPAIRWRRFLVLNLIGATLWATIVTGLGVLFGEAIRYLMADLKEYQPYVLGGVVVLVASWWLIRRAGQRAPVPPGRSRHD